MGVVLIGGGARSGKSRFALQLAEERFKRPAYVATAEALDDEMRERIRKHQQDRGPHWKTIEEPTDIAAAMRREASTADGLVVDCLTLWVSNLMTEPDGEIRRRFGELLRHLEQSELPGTILITNEVGCGIVPDNPLARRFRDLAGELNQEVARLSDEVYWMVFSMPVAVKERAARLRG